MGGSTAQRFVRLVDELIDRAHGDWPAVTFVLTFPSGEQVLLPRHLAGLAPCHGRHIGYMNTVLRPHLQGDPAPGFRGTCRAVPLRTAPADAPEYRLQLRSGRLERWRAGRPIAGDGAAPQA